MLETQTSLSTPSPDRVLNTRAALRNMRPVTLEVITHELRQFGYQCQAWQILRRYGRLPKKVRGYGSARGDHWTDVFREFLRNIETWGWFGIDWDLINGSYQSWMESGEPEWFESWLTFIPIERYGFSDYDEGWPEQYQSIAILKALIDPDWGEDFLGDWIDHFGLVADWNSINHYQLQKRLTSHDFRHYGKPLCWLPDVARMAMGLTGNNLMDFSNYFEDEPEQYTWANGLEEAKQVYQEAKPWIEKLRAFLAWCDGPGEMQAMVDALVGEPAPARKRGKRKSKLNTLVEVLTPGVERVRVRI